MAFERAQAGGGGRARAEGVFFKGQAELAHEPGVQVGFERGLLRLLPAVNPVEKTADQGQRDELGQDGQPACGQEGGEGGEVQFRGFFEGWSGYLSTDFS